MTTTGQHDLAPVLGEIRAALDEAAGVVDGICGAVEVALAAAPSVAQEVVGQVGAEIAGLRAAFADVTGALGAMLGGAGDPAALRAAGRTLIDGIGGPVSRVVGVFSDDVLETDDRWTGAAADAYRATLPAQRAALTALATLCQEVDDTLNLLASALMRFWVAVASACIGLVLTLAGALGSAATVVGAPASAAMALAGVAALVTAGSAALVGLTDVTLTATERSAALVRRLADSTAFPNGAWPRSTTGVSTRPGDWRLR